MASVAVAVAAVTNENSADNSNSAIAPQTWHYDSTDTSPGAFSNAANWEPGNSAPNTCETTGERPCEISVEASNELELQDILTGLTNDDVLDLNPNSKKP